MPSTPAQTFDCPACGAPLDLAAGQGPLIVCPFCRSTVIVPAELRITNILSPLVTTTGADLDLEALARQGAALREIMSLLHEGQKTEAVKRFRQTFGVGLKEAKDAVEALERGQPVNLTSLSLAHAETPAAIDPAEIEALLHSGQKIEAIKLYRSLTGLGLKESKDAIEALEAGQPLPVPARPSDMTGVAGEADLLEKTAALGRAAQLVQVGEREEAVHVYRQAFDVSQAEASAAIQAIANGRFDEVAAKALATPYVSLVTPPPSRAIARAAGVAGLGVGCYVTGLIAFISLITIVPILFGLAQRGGPLFGAWSRVNPLAPARVTLAFGAEGTGPGYFTDPRSIAVDNATGRLYVGEFSGARLQAFDSDGKYLTQWMAVAAAGDGDAYLPRLAVDRQGVVYAVSSGELLRFSGENGQPLGSLEANHDLGGSVYFDDVAAAADGGLVAIVDGETVLRFDASGRLAQTIPQAISQVSGDSELDARAALDGLGNLYLLGTFNNAVFKFSPDGRYITRFGSAGDQPGQFSAPSSIAVDNQGRIYVGDIHGIQIFDSDGRYLDRFEVEGFPFGMAFDDQNRLFVVTNAPKVIRLELKID